MMWLINERCRYVDNDSQEWSYSVSIYVVLCYIISLPLQDYHENRHIQCKSVSRGLDKGSLFYMGIVKDGVRCGDNMICMNQTCVDLAPMSRHTKCPESIPPHGGRPVECSTNGVRKIKTWSSNLQKVFLCQWTMTSPCLYHWENSDCLVFMVQFWICEWGQCVLLLFVKRFKDCFIAFLTSEMFQYQHLCLWPGLEWHRLFYACCLVPHGAATAPAPPANSGPAGSHAPGGGAHKVPHSCV